MCVGGGGVANNMHPLSWGGMAQTEKIPKLLHHFGGNGGSFDAKVGFLGGGGGGGGVKRCKSRGNEV